MLYPNAALNFWDARYHCKKEGGDLAMILNSTGHMMIIQAFVDAGVTSDVWIGLASKDFIVSTEKANWAWLISGQTPIDDLWGSGEPNNFIGFPRHMWNLARRCPQLGEYTSKLSWVITIFRQHAPSDGH